MPSLDEQLETLIESKFAAITVANGFETTVVTAYRASQVEDNSLPGDPTLLRPSQMPAVQLRVYGRVGKVLREVALEKLTRFAAMCVVETPGALEALVRDVEEQILANRAWNNGSADLADGTWIVEHDPHEVETPEPTTTRAVFFEVLTRQALADASTRKAI